MVGKVNIPRVALGLKIISALMIIVGILVALLAFGIIGLYFISGDNVVSAGSLIFFLLLFVSSYSVLEIIAGVLGFRAVKDAAKAQTAFIFGLVVLVLNASSLALNVSIFNVAFCVLPLLYAILNWIIFQDYREGKEGSSLE